MSECEKSKVQVRRYVKSLLGWQTDCFAIEHKATANDDYVVPPDYAFIFIPGNPGLVEWYIELFRQLVISSGVSFSAYGVANAGHSLDVYKREAQATSVPEIAWSVEGQSLHKCAFVEQILEELPGHTRLVFVGHSIGCHFIQRICVLRTDILRRASMAIYLMPFIRMDAPKSKQSLLDFAGANARKIAGTVRTVLHVSKIVPIFALDQLLRPTVPDEYGREVACKLARLPKFANYLFRLGLEEVRDIPQDFDINGLRILLSQCPIHILYASNDHWGPLFHAQEIENGIKGIDFQSTRIRHVYNQNLSHDFIVDPKQIPGVVHFCLQALKSSNFCRGDPFISARL